MTTTRTDEQLDAARDALAAWVSRVRSGDFAATPSARRCRWCDYAALCPSNVTGSRYAETGPVEDGTGKPPWRSRGVCERNVPSRSVDEVEHDNVNTSGHRV